MTPYLRTMFTSRLSPQPNIKNKHRNSTKNKYPTYQHKHITKIQEKHRNSTNTKYPKNDQQKRVRKPPSIRSRLQFGLISNQRARQYIKHELMQYIQGKINIDQFLFNVNVIEAYGTAKIMLLGEILKDVDNKLKNIQELARAAPT